MSNSQKLMWDDERFSKISENIEKITKTYAEHMLRQAGLADYQQEATLTVFDNACGPGVVTSALHKMLRPRSQESYSVTCGDLADAMVNAARSRVKAENWTNTEVFKIDAQDTKLPSDHYTHIFTNFGPMLFPDSGAMLAECNRMLKRGGTCAFTTWKHVAWVEDVRGAMQSMPNLPALPPADVVAKALSNEAWDEVDFIRQKMSSHGFINVKIETVANTSRFVDSAELKAVLVPTIAIVASKLWTQEEREKFERPELSEKIQRWIEEKYKGGPVEWEWVGLVTTSIKP